MSFFFRARTRCLSREERSLAQKDPNVVTDSWERSYSGLTFDFVTKSYVFTAIGHETTLSFSQSNGGPSSPELDNVRITMIPEPSTLALLATGFASAAALRRRRRRGA
jgi:hypothetical protein